MKQKVTLFLSALVCVVSLSAKGISEAEARLIADRFFTAADGAQPLRSLRSAVCTTAASGHAVDYYVFNRGNGEGFVIVAGDDAAHSILGYSDTGSLDYDNAPAHLRAWLDGYAREMAYLRDYSAGVSSPTAASAAAFAPVSPLLGNIAWDQLKPYNGMTPCYVGTVHSATGCVATAMAQIMYYHRWPERGTGSHYYTPVGWRTEVGADFSQSVYDWEAMLPRYDPDASQRSKDAVALLMRDCGVAVNMVYGAQSGSNIEDWPRPLIEHFNYDESLGLLNRKYYTQQEWDAIIRDEIRAGRPVFSTGFTENSGGHAYVFDGYDAQGLIHVNWGWSGMSNGYFRTSALTPATQGTGGSAGGFNYRQGIIIGIRPPGEDTEPILQIVSSEKMKAMPAACGKDDDVSLRLTGKVTNYGWRDVAVDMGIAVFDADGDLSLVATAKENVSLPVEEYVVGITVEAMNFASLPEGTYEVRPVVRNHGGTRWTKVRDYNYKKKNRLTLTVSAEGLAFAEPESFSLVAESLEATEMYRGISVKVSATVRNQGGTEYNGGICAALLSPTDDVVVERAPEYIQDIMPGGSAYMEFIGSFASEAGSYRLVLLDEDARRLCAPLEVTLQEMPAEVAELQMAEQLSFDDNAAVPPDSLALTARMRCTGGVFANDVIVYLYDGSGTTVVGSLDPQFVFVKGGESVDVDFSGTFENGVPGTDYRAVVINLSYNSYILPMDMASCAFTLAGSPSGLEDVQAADDTGDGDVYTITGALVRRDGTLEGLPRGFYLMNGKKYFVK